MYGICDTIQSHDAWAMNSSDDLDDKLYGFRMDDVHPDAIEFLTVNPCLSMVDNTRTENLLNNPFDWYRNSTYTEEVVDAARSE